MREPVTVPAVAARKRARGAIPIVMVTAYDAPFATIVDEAGVDVILVGDSVGNTVLGYENSLGVDMAQMVHHVGAVARAKPAALVVGDMPWMSYHVDPRETVRNAAALVRAGAQAVKLEGGRRRIPAVRAILDAEIPVMGHLGLTPQSLHALGGLTVQARAAEAARELEIDARELAAAGCFAVVLEGVPDLVASRVTAAIEIPTIGIGAGPDCDGQVLVLHDLLGLSDGRVPKFVRRYAELGTTAREAIAAFAADVRSGDYPSAAETYHAPADLRRELRAGPGT
ncbi:MAG: 3-methyl-2-oxobutanoate hydroxymethyltransferase [Acidimicrobiales bacterium]|jgi:3-methyl-2-oxobutanoate hydroxymethyltransferase